MTDLHISLSKRPVISSHHGPGKRLVLTLSGTLSAQCTMAVESLKHSEATSGGHYSVESICRELFLHGVEGITLCGGDPIEQSNEIAELLRHVKEAELTAMVYTSLTLSELRSMAVHHRAVRWILHHTDLLITGPYLPKKKDRSRAWIASSNQRIHYLSGAYEISIDGQKRAYETIRLTSPANQSKPFTLHRSGWPYQDSETEQLVHTPILCDPTWIHGYRWLEELFERMPLSVKLSQRWDMNTEFWVAAMTRARGNAVGWLLGMTDNQLILGLEGDDLVEKEIWEVDLEKDLPLVFGEASQALLSGPKEWRTTLLRTWLKDPVYEVTTEGPRDEIGDWLLLASLWPHLTCHESLKMICTQYVKKPISQRTQLRHWFYRYSPICALLQPVEGIQYLKSVWLRDKGKVEQVNLLFSMCSPGVIQSWCDQLHQEKVTHGIFSQDGWSVLESLRELNDWALTHRHYVIGEMCISTISHVLSPIDPEEYYALTASSSEELRTIRERRLLVVEVAVRWAEELANLHRITYGDEEYGPAQLGLRYRARWSTFSTRLDPLRKYASKLALHEVREED